MSLLRSLFGIVVLLGTYGCGSESANLSQSKNTQTYGGWITAPDGLTPLAAAHVSTMEIAGSTCEEASVVCTDSEGYFELNLGNDTEPVTLYISKGVFHASHQVEMNQAAGFGTLALPVDPGQNGARLAVVTGQYDRMQDILAKLGFAVLDPSSFQLQLGSEGFQLYDGDDSLDESYPNMDDLFVDRDADGQADLFDFDVVFINCNPSDRYAHWLGDPDKQALLRQYVNNGGNLFVSDLAYNFIETLFADQLDFYSDDLALDMQIEVMDAALTGVGGLSTLVSVNNPILTAWLANLSCFEGPCINNDGTISVSGFKPAWAVLNGPHPSSQNTISSWAEAQVQWMDYVGRTYTGVKPLMVMFDIGAGTVVFTSFHVHNGGQAADLLQQERLLQYVVFEM